MTPEQIAAFSAIATLLERIGTWPVGTLIVVMLISPWAILVWVTITQRKQLDEFVKSANTQSAQFKQMYENNAELVKGFLRLSTDLHDTVVLNIRELTEMKDIAKNNQICPLVREQGRMKP
ncbi:MAG: hypothetical protein AB7E76_02770 [Deferribacterales bacterium]